MSLGSGLLPVAGNETHRRLGEKGRPAVSPKRLEGHLAVRHASHLTGALASANVQLNGVLESTGHLHWVSPLMGRLHDVAASAGDANDLVIESLRVRVGIPR